MGEKQTYKYKVRIPKVKEAAEEDLELEWTWNDEKEPNIGTVEKFMNDYPKNIEKRAKLTVHRVSVSLENAKDLENSKERPFLFSMDVGHTGN